jgi:hypothetical protein
MLSAFDWYPSFGWQWEMRLSESLDDQNYRKELDANKVTYMTQVDAAGQTRGRWNSSSSLTPSGGCHRRRRTRDLKGSRTRNAHTILIH